MTPLDAAKRIIERTYSMGELEADAKSVAQAYVRLLEQPPGVGEASGRADALLSGLKVGRMPDGKHFASDICAVLAFGKWYARQEANIRQCRKAARAEALEEAAACVATYSAIPEYMKIVNNIRALKEP